MPVLTLWVSEVWEVYGEAAAAGVRLLPLPLIASGRFRAVGPYGTTVEFAEMRPETLVSRLLAKTDTVTPWAIRAAVTLRLPDLLADRSLSAAEAADRTGTEPDALHRLLRLLARHGILAEAADGGFRGTVLSGALREDHASGLVSSLDLGSAQARIDEVSRGVIHSIRTGKPVYEHLFGLPLWEDFATEPGLSESFQEWMSRKTTLLASSFIEGYDWSGVRHVMDVGGGRGTLLAALLDSAPSLRGILLELPETAADAVGELSASSAANRISVVGGSFFDPLPAGADTVLLHNVLVNWDDEASIHILRRCAEAVGPDGRVLILEGLPEANADGDSEREGGILDDQRLLAQINLLMLMLFGGKERCLTEYDQLAAAAGLAITSVSPTSSGVFIMECREVAGNRPTG
ncbi:methyltransferase [Streptomyces sp. NA02950]|uniref:methyltransferase n=1 Tax=Streptomyces sp. NA02950 TaxID=2742137 RepID=UPI00159014BB|nr:methyltransferase [Streptomyces sp. NA02950]QKV93055.1 methyltransferase [Streptomyces sp. NA02950]